MAVKIVVEIKMDDVPNQLFFFDVSGTARIAPMGQANEIVQGILSCGYKNITDKFVEYYPPHRIHSIKIYPDD